MCQSPSVSWASAISYSDRLQGNQNSPRIFRKLLFLKNFRRFCNSWNGHLFSPAIFGDLIATVSCKRSSEKSCSPKTLKCCHWHQEALAVDAKERQVRRELENMLGIELPDRSRSFGKAGSRPNWSSADGTASVNRHQIASYTRPVPRHPQQQWSRARRPH